MNISRILRQARLQKKLSQMEVARRSHISLATIQNIEAGRANPEWDTLSALLKALSLKIEVQSQPLDWLLLASLGCPLLMNSTHPTEPNRSDLVEFLATTDISLHKTQMDDRQTLALANWLWALRDHYPSLWEQTHRVTRKWLETLQPANIKLRRLALSRLATYL
jgi:transcriptional regulator with XRE-family HTH domain